MHNYKELKIWQKAMELLVEVYKATATFPKEEKYGLTQQIQRSVVSIPSNIAEGAGRNSDKEFIQFLSISNGSCYELETQLIAEHKLKYLDEEHLAKLIVVITEIQKMNYNLQKSLRP